MTSILERWLFPAEPPTRLAAMRILVSLFAIVYLLARAVHLTDFSQLDEAAFQPVGPISVLEAPWPPALVLSTFVIALLSGIAVCFGVYHPFTGPTFGLSLLWVLSYRNSWGMIFHTENLLVISALILSVAPAADVWSWDARRRNVASDATPSRRFGWALLALRWVVVLSYVVAGVAKLRAAGMDWAGGEVLRSHVAFDALRKLELGSVYSPIGAALVSQPWVFTPLAWLTLALEIGAPLALLGRRWAIVWCSTAWAFHFGVLVLMAIVFPYPLLGIAYAPFFAVERMFERWLWPVWQRVVPTSRPA